MMTVLGHCTCGLFWVTFLTSGPFFPAPHTHTTAPSFLVHVLGLHKQTLGTQALSLPGNPGHLRVTPRWA